MQVDSTAVHGTRAGRIRANGHKAGVQIAIHPDADGG